MSRFQKFRVCDSKGAQGFMLATSRFLDDSPERLVELQDGREVLVDRQRLRPREDGSYLLEGSFDDLVIPVVQEEISVSKQVVESGRVRISKHVQETETIVDEPLLESSYDIERVALNRVISEAPKARYEGETLVLPVVEEVLVVEKRLVLREEVRITPKSEEVRKPQTHSVRQEHVEVERL